MNKKPHTGGCAWTTHKEKTLFETVCFKLQDGVLIDYWRGGRLKTGH